MKTLTKYNAPVTLTGLLFIFGLPLVLMFAWIGIVAPPLARMILPLQDGSPVIYEVLHGFIAVMFLPLFGVAFFVAIHFYQKQYDRKKSGHDAA